MKTIYILIIAIFTINIANAQWTQTSLDSNTVTSIVISGNNIFAGTWNGVYISSDNGDNWTLSNNGITDTFITVLNINGDNIFAGTLDSGIFLSTNNGANWTPINNGLTNKLIYTIVNDGANIFAGTAGGAFLSTNNGNNWIPITTGLPNYYTVYRLIINNNNIYASTLGEGLYFTTINNYNWAKIEEGLENFSVTSSIAIIGNNILVASSDGLFLTNDIGNNWVNVSAGVIEHDYINTFVVFGDKILATSKFGVYISTNNGYSWSWTGEGLTYENWSLVISGNTVFIGTYKGGVWKLPLSELGIKENTFNNNISIYPNPASDRLNMQFRDAIEGGYVLDVYNYLGKKVISEKVSQMEAEHQLNTMSLNNGIYIYNITTTTNIYKGKFTIIK